MLPALTRSLSIYDDIVALLVQDKVLVIGAEDLLSQSKEYLELPEIAEAMWLFSHGLYLRTSRQTVVKYPVKELQVQATGPKMRRKSFQLSEGADS
jgi:hypothetical protein